MKKSIIATGAASLALAAMPVVGVFAVPADINTMTDTIRVTVPSSCSIVNSNTDATAAVANVANTYVDTIPNGQHKTLGGNGTGAGNDSGIGVSCNSDGQDAAWRLTAIGDGTSGHTTELYDGTANSIPSVSNPHPTSGAASDWAFRVVITPGTNNTVHAADQFTSNTWTAVPSAEKDIAEGTGTAAEGTFVMDYDVYVSGTQPGGTYEGKVKYTLYNPAS